MPALHDAPEAGLRRRVRDGVQVQSVRDGVQVQPVRDGVQVQPVRGYTFVAVAALALALSLAWEQEPVAVREAERSLAGEPEQVQVCRSEPYWGR